MSHYNSNNNPAALFSQKINSGSVFASDGTVFNWGREHFFIGGGYLYCSIDDDTFFEFFTGSREDVLNDRNISYRTIYNKGWIIYTYSNKTVHTSDSLGYDLKIDDMLEILK